MSEKLHEEKEIVKLEKKLGGEIASEYRAMSKEALDFKMLQLAKYRQEIMTTRKEDPDLVAAKERVKELDAPYKEQMKDNELKSRMVALIIKEKND